MYRDTEQCYGNFTLDVFETNSGWQCDWWDRGDTSNCGSTQSPRRKECIRLAKSEICRAGVLLLRESVKHAIGRKTLMSVNNKQDETPVCIETDTLTIDGDPVDLS